MRTAGALLVGWFVAGLAISLLYLAGDAVGAIGRSYAYLGASPDGPSFLGVRSPSDWPFPDSGLWAVFANVAVVARVLVLATLATGWWLRRLSVHVRYHIFGVPLTETVRAFAKLGRPC